MIQIFTDGACEPVNPNGIATYGFVIYKDNERIAEDSGVITDKSSSNNVAEYTAANEAFNRLLKKFYTELPGESIILKSDSQLLINQLTGTYKVSAQRILPLYSKLKRVIKKVKQISPKPKIRFSWIPREKNEEADTLSIHAYENFCRYNPAVLHQYTKYLATKRQKSLMQKIKIPYGPGISKRKASELINARLTKLKERKKGAKTKPLHPSQTSGAKTSGYAEA